MLLEGEALKDRGHAVHQVRKLFNVAFVGNVAQFDDGSTVQVDAVILCTGFY